QFSSRAAWWLGRERGVFGPLPSPEEATARSYSEAERESVGRLRRRAILGTGPQVARTLLDLAAANGVEEVAVLTTTHDPEVRR
ncbi:MAG: LLM class flavin-dependent oxidoreductase, partial [Acetobacteraceae bacterium]